MTNRHPVDQLAEIRISIAALKVKEAELRSLIISGECTLEGDDSIATVTPTDRRFLAVRKIEEIMGTEWIKEFASVRKSMTIRIKGKR